MSARERRSVIATSSTPRSCSRPLSACTSTPGLTPCVGAAAAHGGDVGVQAQRELADHRLLVELLDAVERGEPLARVVGAREQQLAELDDARGARASVR